ncbi:MAG: hypothetical protein IK078_10545 [Lachnospiraceae bacterium]|nr:hypothetical protein [Lachnospiraceae bacterium]
MACFVVPAVEAIVVTAVAKAEEKKEMKLFETKGNVTQEKSSIPLSRKLKWLTKLLWGGVILLLFEHIWHGEVVPWFPFLTAMGNPIDAAEMFHEMATVGVLMAVLCTAVWIIMCKVADVIVKRPEVAKAKVKA